MTRQTFHLTAAVVASLLIVASSAVAQAREAAISGKAEWPEGVTDEKSLSWVQKHKIDAYEDDKKDLMGLLFDAHLAMQLQSREQAERKIGKAFDRLEALVADCSEITAAYEPRLVKLVELKYGSMLAPVLVYIPVSSDDLGMDDFVPVLDVRAIGQGNIEDARVRYVALSLDRDKLLHDLNDARQELMDGNFDGARDQLVDAQQSMIAEMEAAPSRQVAARDNVSLTRFMLKAAEYEGAREALKAAERALMALADDKDVLGRNAPEVETIRKEMRELSGMIERRDPTLADQIDKQLEAWWNSLS